MTQWTPVPTTLPEWLSFYRQYEWVLAATQVLSLAVPLTFLFLGIAPRLRTWSARLARGNPYVTITLFGAAYLALVAIVTLPVSYLGQLAFFRAWHIPTSSDAQWLAGRGVTLATEILLTAALAWIPYAFLRYQRRLWWLYTAAVLVVVLAMGLLIYQRALMPVWTAYRPLPSGPLAARVQELGERCGVKHLRILVGGNDDATVIGLQPFNQIVVSENFMRDLTEPEQVVALAHELKHYITGDSWEGVGLIAGYLLLALWLVDVLGRGLLARFRGRWGFSELADPASLPLILCILTVVWLGAGLPAFNAGQRHAEFEADRLALELTRLNHAQGMLQSHNTPHSLNEYDWFYRLWMANHPSASERVRFANTYHPWENGGALEGSRLCRMPNP
jgi:STE24 endopeptidase